MNVLSIGTAIGFVVVTSQVLAQEVLEPSEGWQEAGPELLGSVEGSEADEGETAVEAGKPRAEVVLEARTATAPDPPDEPHPAPAEPLEEVPEALPEWTRHIRIGGGTILYYYQPTAGGGDPNFSVFFANLLLDANWGSFGVHLEPRFRDTRLRPFFEGPAWLQEAYVSAATEVVTLKLGKLYKRLGLFWDNSFYGNVQVYDGLKLDPNYGAALEGSVGESVGVDYSVQYFIVDGRTNVSLQGRDTLSVAGARRRNSVTARVEPFVRFAQAGRFGVGVSAERLIADLPSDEGAPNRKDPVTRYALDAKLTYDFGALGALGLWGEYLHQTGRHVLDHPAVGGASGENTYVLAGIEYGVGRFTARYNLSRVDYADVDTQEILHVPALAVKFEDHVTVLGEYVVWRQTTPAGEVPYDTSLNVTLHARF